MADRAQERSALFVATLTSFMGPFIISSVNVALPSIQREFSINAIQLSWIATSLLVAVAVTLVPAGRIADIYGRKKIFTLGLVIYTLATGFAGFSGSAEMLILFRVIQGVGAAMFVTTGMAILTSIFPPQKRGRVIGIYVAAVYIGLSAGPFIGGMLTQHLGWRSIFFVVFPFGIASIWITLKYLKGEWADAKGETLDIAGTVLYAISIFSLVYGSSLLPDVKAFYFGIGGVISFYAFIRRQLSTRFPVFEVRLFSQNRLFTFSSIAALIHYSATFSVTFFISLYLQYIKAIPPQVAGTLLVAQPLMMALFSPLAGRLSDRIEPRKIASSGMLLTAIGLFLFASIGKTTGSGFIVGVLAMLGFGFALFSSPNMNAIMGSVEKKFFGIASGAVATMRLLGQMTSMAVAMVVFAVFIGHEQISPDNYDRFLKALNVSFIIFALMCCIGIFFSLFRGELRNETK
ncbi:MAG: MFS transporter [Thermodesulfobacteriota bacterium]